MSESQNESRSKLLKVIEHHWGFHALRPLQEEAIGTVLQKRDSLVVLPTGGGKSLCYQAPAMIQGGTTVVISPLISLMKDQVDSLQRVGVPAIQLDSSQSPPEREAYEFDIRQGAIRLLFVSPERLVLNEFVQLLKQIDVQTFAIDEAHCISHWGHDFRPEYRQLRQLRTQFPKASMHAYTATATEQVRQDIIAQLHLKDPTVLVGNFDRPNLTYRVLPRLDPLKQVRDVLDRHKDEPGIIYCLRRTDVDTMSAALAGLGYNVRAYHAGLSAEERREAQDDFASEKVDLIVATVAFGMGIDRSNVRFVLHAAMPKSLEHYQQETGRAGRDGLEAECVLLYSGSDFFTWKSIIERSAEEAGEGVDPNFVPNAIRHVNDMSRYCRGASCRHRALVEYFDQEYTQESCNACDLCLGDVEEVADSAVIAQKILSCVARVKERFGINHVLSVLRGDNTENIRKWGHDQLTTYKLLEGTPKAVLRDWIYQLLEQKVLLKAGDEYPTLALNDASWQVMRGERDVRLIQLVKRKRGEGPVKSKSTEVSWEGVDKGLFEQLRKLRRTFASEQQVPPYRIFSDAVLRELARVRPSTLERMGMISGIGSVKLRDYGQAFLDDITKYCRGHGLDFDQG